MITDIPSLPAHEAKTVLRRMINLNNANIMRVRELDLPSSQELVNAMVADTSALELMYSHTKEN